MSLRARLLASFAYVLVLVIVALEVPLSLNLAKRVDAEVRAESAGQSQLVAASASGRLGQPEELERLVGRAAQSLGGRVVIVDARGRLLADSAGTGLRLEPYAANRPEIARALRGETAQGERRSDSLDQDLLFTAVPIVQDGRTAGAVRVTQSVEAVDDAVRGDTLALVGVGVVALVLGLAVAWLIAGSLSRPLRALAATARRIAGGDLEARADETGPAEQKEVARAFNDMTGRLARSLEAQREFVANASHQLRTPLTGLKLRLEAAGLKAGDPAVERELAAAERETDRLARLLDELLTLAREAGGPAAGDEVSVRECVTTACERWEGRAEQLGHRLECSGDGDPRVVATRHDLAIVLDNLIENALVYSPAGTGVCVGWSEGGHEVRIAVLDEGPGVAPGEHESVFQRFYRGAAGRRGVEGTGLGLAIVDALVRRWGGTARIANRPGGGACAEVRLPVALPSADLHQDGSLPRARTIGPT